MARFAEKSKAKPAQAALGAVDRLRFLATQLADPGDREALAALFMLEWELARAGLRNQEPLLTTMRFQWWREAIEELPTRFRAPFLGGIDQPFGNQGKAFLLTLVDAYEDWADPQSNTEAALEACAAAAGALHAHLWGEKPAFDALQAAFSAHLACRSARGTAFFSENTRQNLLVNAKKAANKAPKAAFPSLVMLAGLTKNGAMPAFKLGFRVGLAGLFGRL